MKDPKEEEELFFILKFRIIFLILCLISETETHTDGKRMMMTKRKGLEREKVPGKSCQCLQVSAEGAGDNAISMR